MAMNKDNRITIGMDLSDRKADVCIFDGKDVLDETRLTLSREGVVAAFEVFEPCRVVLEVGTHSPWVSRLLQKLGFEVIVANPLQFRMICDSYKKDDRTDAEMLARVGHMDPVLLNPIEHRGEDIQSGLAFVRSRAALVRARTLLINHARGLVKSFGERLSSCKADAFHSRLDEVPAGLQDALGPVFAAVEQLTAQIKHLDGVLRDLASEVYPETQVLQTVPGVGPITALTYVLTLERPDRFASSRAAGSYIGLSPGRRQSGKVDRDMHITKHGDRHLRWLLVQCAHYILGPFAPDSELRDWGFRLIDRGGRAAKRRAVVAVARKLAVLLHTLWLRQERYTTHPCQAAA
jgi:transposase